MTSTGAIRDLWPDFIESREKAHGGRQRKTRPALGGGASDGMELDAMEEGRAGAPLPDWMVIVNTVKDTIEKLKLELVDLEKAQATQLKGGDNLFDIQEEQGNRSEVDALNKTIGKRFNNANNMVKQLTHGATNEDKRVRKNIQMGLAGDLQVLSTKFRKKHKKFLSQISEQRNKIDATGNKFKFDENADEDDVDGDATWSHEQLEELGHMDRLIDERDKEITQIAKQVSDLAQLFRELSVLVIDQGTILDRIDYNMEEVVVNFEEAETELKEVPAITYH